MKLNELRNIFFGGGIAKRLYWQLAREGYTHVLPQIQEVITENNEVDSITLSQDGIILKRADGVLLYFDFQQAICRAEIDLLMEGDPEKYDMAYIDQCLSEHQHGCMLDIGANVGIFSLNFYQKHNKLKYYLFEPVPTTFKWLLKNADINHVDTDRYLPFNIGMSDKKGSFIFYVPSSNEAASLVANEDEFYRKKTTEYGDYTGDNKIDEIVCSVETVDDFVLGHNIRDIRFIKIDVEGNELSVLHGAKNTLCENKPLVYCELLRMHAKRFGYHPNKVINFMAELGFRCRTIRQGKLIELMEITDQTVETNFFFD